MIRTVIFDLDGVLLGDTTPGYHDCFNAALEGVDVAMERKLQEQRIALTWGSVGRVHLQSLLQEELATRDSKAGKSMLDTAEAIYHEHLLSDTFASHARAIPGAAEALAELQDSCALTIATGMHPELLKVMLPRFKFPLNMFARIESSYDLDNPRLAKPNPFMLNKIMSELKLKKKETVKVGDAMPDIVSAREAGIEPVLVLSGNMTREEGEWLEIEHIITDVTYLKQELETINNSYE